jgi:hypothetical protein
LSGLAGSVSYSGGQPSGWLTTSFTSTTAPADLALQLNTALPPGSYTATVTVSSSPPTNAPQITVRYDVPAIGLQATSASFTATESGTDPAPQSIGVFNAGGGTLNGLTASVNYAGGEPTGWLNASVPSAAPRSPGSVPLTLAVTTGTIPPGAYTATVTLSSTTLPSVPSEVVTVTFTRVATLSGDIQPIFSGNCTACHYDGLASDGVNLSTVQQSYDNLVNAAVATPGVSATRVVPGDSLASYLMSQLKGTAAASADNMPPGCTSGNTGCLDPALVHRIAIWIQQGARRDP